MVGALPPHSQNSPPIANFWLHACVIALLSESKNNTAFDISKLCCAYINTKIIATPPLNKFCSETEITTKLIISSAAKGAVPPCIGFKTKMHDKKNMTTFSLPRQCFAVIWLLKWFKATFKTFIIFIIFLEGRGY